MAVTPRAVAAEAIARLLYLRRLRAAALALTFSGSPGARLRASELAALVASQLNEQDSPWFRRDLTMALRADGWTSVVRARVRMWKGRVFR